MGPSDGSGQGAEEGDGTARLWRTVIIGDQEHRIDMQVIRPYLRVVTHGGQCNLHPKGTVHHEMQEWGICWEKEFQYVTGQ